MSEELVKALTLDDTLDDIKRAQIWARVEAGLEARAVPARRTGARVAAIGAAVAAAAAVVAVAVFALRGRAGAAEPTALVAPPDTTLSWKIGSHVRASLVGPGRLEPVALGDRAVVRLRSGTLLADFAGGGGRSLEILAPDATIDIVGTLFAVEVGATATCVSVAHGTVRMTSGPRTYTIRDRQRACSHDAAVQSIGLAMQDALARHDAVLAASESRPTPPSPPPSPRPPVQTADRFLAPNPTSTPQTGPGDAVAMAAAVAPPAREPVARSVPPRVARAEPAAPVALVARAELPPRAELAPRIASAPRTAPAPQPEPAQAVDASPRSSPSTAPAPPAEPARATDASPRPLPQPPSAPPVDLYREADRALARHDLTAADHSLAALLAQHPASPLLDQALYERARIAVERRAWADARAQLAQLARVEHSPLAEPGAYLACTAAPAAEREQCLLVFHAQYPQSPHDAHVLGELIQRAFDAGGCAKARARIGELARAHADAARPWRARCPEAP